MRMVRHVILSILMNQSETQLPFTTTQARLHYPGCVTVLWQQQRALLASSPCQWEEKVRLTHWTLNYSIVSGFCKRKLNWTDHKYCKHYSEVTIGCNKKMSKIRLQFVQHACAKSDLLINLSDSESKSKFQFVVS